MKRLLTKNHLSIFLITLFLGVFTSIAQSQDVEVTFLESYSYNDTFYIDIYVDSIQQIGSFTGSIQFDTTQLSLVNIADRTGLAGSSFGFNQIDSLYIIGWFNLAPITQADTIFRITLVKKNEFCNLPINWTGTLQVSDNLGDIFPSNFINGTIYFLEEEIPDLVYPTPNSSNIPINTLFQWDGNNLNCINGYRFQLATDTNFTQIIIDTLLNNTILPIGGMQSLFTHYWRVGKVDELDNVYWSGHRTFTTQLLDTIQVQIEETFTFSDSIIIPVTIQNTEYLGGFDLVINYDTTAYANPNFQNILAFPNDIIINDTTYGRIAFSWQTLTTPVIFPSDTLFEVVFYKKANCNGFINWDTTGQSSHFYFNNNLSLPAIFQNGDGVFLDTLPVDLIFPLDSSEQVFIRPEMTWTSLDCSNNYRIQMAFDANFTNIQVDTFVVDTIFTPINLLGDTTYYWRVGRNNAVDSLYLSEVWEFRTEIVFPVFIRTETIITQNDTFAFPIMIDSLENAIAFELNLNYDTASIQLLNYFDTTTFISNLTIQDLNGTIKISWQSTDSTLQNTANINSDTLLQLQFIRQANCSTPLTWNAITSDFFHINDVINMDAFYENNLVYFVNDSVPNLVIPTNNANTILYADVVWQPVPCAVQYHLEVALDNQFTQVILDSIQTDTAVWLTNLQANTTYFWRVAKEDLLGDLYWSDTLSFTTGSVYTTSISMDNFLTYDDTINVNIVIDSSFYLTKFDLFLDYNNVELAFLGSNNSIFNTLQIIDNNGEIELFWQDTLQPRFIIQDTLITLQFANISACLTGLDWNINTSNFTYRANQNLSPTQFQNNTIEFLNRNNPTLITPFDGETDIETVSNFEWQSVDCSVNYQLQIAEDSNFTILVLDTLNLVDTFFNNITLNHTTTYYWRVGRFDSQNDLYWSDTLVFTTVNLPTIFVRTGDTLTYSDTLSVPVILENLIKIQAFELQLNYDNFAMQFSNISDTLFDIIVNESNGNITINWTASSLNNLINITSDTLLWLNFIPKEDCYTALIWNESETNFVYEDPTAIIDLGIQNGSLYWINNNPPSLIFPNNDTLFLTPAFQLRWEIIICAESYAIQFSKTEDFNTVELEIPNILTNSYAIFGLIPNEKYYWRVGQVDALNEIHWSTIWNFTIDRTDFQVYRVYPNPTQGNLTLWFDESSENPATITIYNIAGQLMQTYNIERRGKAIELDLSPFQNGLCYLKFVSEDMRFLKKIIVEH